MNEIRVRDLLEFLQTTDPELPVRYEELGFGKPLWTGPCIHDFKVVEGCLLIPQIEQEYPE
jgi:hypothetical protein